MALLDEILKQLDAIVERREALPDGDLTDRQVIGLLTSAHAAIERLAPPGTPYRSRCESLMQSEWIDSYKLDPMIGLIEALKADYQTGGLAAVQQLIRAEIFDDFLDAASYLLDSGYKDPAAVVAGGVLEQQLRRQCVAHAIPTESDKGPKKADGLNAELAAKGAYGKLDQKAVTSWLDLRNKAAHGEYNAYSAEQVRILILGIRDFVRRLAA